MIQAEAELALALRGGATNDAVAARRRVCVTTIRMQVRAILAKTNVSNIRDLERLLALLV
ncbi:MAG: hypothetical protein FJX25_08290 [Alphaproteobacteria bacterium]|nr:hypothetical protein [Alphaproteobacteria bacterium]